MKSIIIIFLFWSVSFSANLLSQESNPAPQNAPAQTTVNIAKSLGVYVFPSNDQDAEMQEYDEFKCYKWAIEASGIDPMNLNVQVQATDDSPDGSAVKGAAKGAAVGAAIGAITGDAGTGAAVGAVSGGFSGLGRGAARRQAKKQQAKKAAADKEVALREEFNRAFSVCLEGKGYTVK